MRTVYVDLSSDICIKPIFAGYEGEHNATQLTVKIPNRMIINNVDYYTFCFELPTGECIESDGYAFQYLNNGELSLYLPKQIMVRGDIIVAINAYCVTTDESTSETTVNLLEKTSEIRLFIENSPNGRYTKYDDRELSNIVWEFVNIQSVLYNEEQNLTDEQKEVARNNIDAVDANLVVSSILDSSAHPRDVKIPNGAALFEYVAEYTRQQCVRNDIQQHLSEDSQEIVRSNIDAVSQAELADGLDEKVDASLVVSNIISDAGALLSDNIPNGDAVVAFVREHGVSSSQVQSLSETKKARARSNINAQKTLPNELEHTKNIGFFINHRGEKKTNAGFFITNPIQFNVGDVIVVNGRGYLQQTAIVSLYNSDAETYTPKLVSYDSAFRYYSYEVEEAGEYVISCEKSNTTYGMPKLYKLTSDCGEFLKTLGVVTTKQEKEIVAQNSTLAQQETRLSNLENITSQVDLSAYASIAMFQKIGVIGDSFASGAISQSQGNPSNVNYPLSWAQILGRSAGIQVENFSSGGYSTRTWLTGAKGLSLLNSSDSQELYICALGINDCNLGETYLGDISDIKDNFEENADSFYGNYGKIIENIKIKSPNAKIILSTLASNSNTAQMFNTAIVEISEHFSIPYIVQRDEPFFTSSFYTSNMVSAHPVAVVYSGMAKAIQRLVEKCMVENIEYFKDYIGIE